jgi:dipeptidyl aminopeptidase/acylaminoacyl peptidase
MNRRQRRLIKLAFMAVFLLTAPAVILSTAGYRYNWSKGRLEKTGIIKFVSKPSGAQIWLNGRLLPHTTPVSEFRLLPEDYHIRLEKPGYHPWEKQLEVQSATTTFTEDVVLIRESNPRRLTDTEWQSGQWSPDRRRLALIREGAGSQELVVLNNLGQEEVLLARLTPQRYQDIELIWSPDGRRLLFQADLAADPTGRELRLYPLPPTEVEPQVLTAAADGQGAALARWSGNGLRLTAKIDGQVNVIDPTSGLVKPVPGTAGAVDAYLSNDRLIAIRPEAGRNLVLAVDPAGQREPQEIANLPMGSWRFGLLNGDRVLLTDDRSGQSVLLRLSDQELFGPWSGRAAAWEDEAAGQSRLLLWNDFEISVWDPQEEQRVVITRLSTPIGECLWDPSGRNVLFTAGGALSVAELDSRDGRNIYQLNRLTEIAGLALDPTGRRSVRFLGAAGEQRALFQQGF